MEAKVRRIGNSMGVILPMDVLNLMGLKEGDAISVTSKTKEVVLTIRKKKRAAAAAK